MVISLVQYLGTRIRPSGSGEGKMSETQQKAKTFEEEVLRWARLR